MKNQTHYEKLQYMYIDIKYTYITYKSTIEKNISIKEIKRFIESKTLESRSMLDPARIQAFFLIHGSGSIEKQARSKVSHLMSLNLKRF